MVNIVVNFVHWFVVAYHRLSLLENLSKDYPYDIMDQGVVGWIQIEGLLYLFPGHWVLFFLKATNQLLITLNPQQHLIPCLFLDHKVPFDSILHKMPNTKSNVKLIQHAYPQDLVPYKTRSTNSTCFTALSESNHNSTNNPAYQRLLLTDLHNMDPCITSTHPDASPAITARFQQMAPIQYRPSVQRADGFKNCYGGSRKEHGSEKGYHDSQIEYSREKIGHGRLTPSSGQASFTSHKGNAYDGKDIYPTHLPVDQVVPGPIRGDHQRRFDEVGRNFKTPPSPIGPAHGNSTSSQAERKVDNSTEITYEDIRRVLEGKSPLEKPRISEWPPFVLHRPNPFQNGTFTLLPSELQRLGPRNNQWCKWNNRVDAEYCEGGGYGRAIERGLGLGMWIWFCMINCWYRNEISRLSGLCLASSGTFGGGMRGFFFRFV